MFANAYRLGPSDDPSGGDDRGGGWIPKAFPPDHEDLAYRVEIWDPAGEVVEQVLAVSSNASIGYAAYFAAAREYPDAIITLRHNNRIMSRWGGKPH